MTRRLGELDVETFIAEYWQRQPCLLRGALANFDFPLDGDDLAGLSCDPLAESRLITGPDADDAWSLHQGPFDESDFATIGDRNWTLLVQDVEKHFPPLRDLLAPFDFLPSWRFDDIMVSFAAPGGSVGPHVDQYDVFLCQVSGHRRWDIAHHFDPERRTDVPIDMLAAFDGELGWDVGPGDVLYLPPGVAHHGVAQEPCLTASVGFRAPSAADLSLALGEWLANREDDGGRYRDPPRSTAPRTGEIDHEALEEMAALLDHALRPGPGRDEFLGHFLSRFRLAHEPVPQPDAPPASEQLDRAIEGDVIVVHPWGRLGWVEDGKDGARLFASGSDFSCSTSLAVWLCSGARGALPDPLDDRDRSCLLGLIAGGHLLVEPKD